MVPITCTSCHTQLEVPEETIGTTVQCEICGTQFTAQTPGPAPTSVIPDIPPVDLPQFNAVTPPPMPSDAGSTPDPTTQPTPTEFGVPPTQEPLPQSQQAPGALVGSVAATEVRCMQCGYDLTGIAIGGVCPECGSLVTPSFHITSQPASGMAITSMVLGIISIPACFCYGIPSVILSILSIIFYVSAKKQVEAGKADRNSMGMAKAGLICGIVGLVLGLGYISFFIVIIASQ